jgi:hypothetical protein
MKFCWVGRRPLKKLPKPQLLNMPKLHPFSIPRISCLTKSNLYHRKAHFLRYNYVPSILIETLWSLTSMGLMRRVWSVDFGRGAPRIRLVYEKYSSFSCRADVQYVCSVSTASLGGFGLTFLAWACKRARSTVSVAGVRSSKYVRLGRSIG